MVIAPPPTRIGALPSPRRRTLQLPGAGSQKYSSSVSPSRRSRSWWDQCQSIWSRSRWFQVWSVTRAASRKYRTAAFRDCWDDGRVTVEGTTERVLRLLALLQRRPSWTAAGLAAELG